MEKIFFTALIPASNLDMKLKRLQQSSELYIPLPPISPLETFNDIVLKDQYNKNIDLIDDLYTAELINKNSWCYIKFSNNTLADFFNTDTDVKLPFDKFKLLIGIGNINLLEDQYPGGDILRNWSLGFFELNIWDDSLNNIELIKHWEIKKKRNKLKTN